MRTGFSWGNMKEGGSHGRRRYRLEDNIKMYRKKVG